MALVAEPDVRDEVLRCVDWLQTQPEEVRRLVRTVPEPRENRGSSLERLQRSVDEQTRAAEVKSRVLARLERLRTRMEASLFEPLQATPTLPQTLAQLERAEALFQRADALKSRLHPTAVSELMTTLASMPSTAEDVLTEVERAVDSPLASLLPSVASLEAIRSIPTFHIPTPQNPGIVPPSSSLVRVKDLRHPLSRQSGLTASTYSAELVWQPPVSGEPYGRVSLPVRLILERPAPAILVVELRVVLGDILRETPLTWLDEVSRQEFLIPQGVEVQDLEVVIPIMRTRAEQLEAERRQITSVPRI
jgi:hypothetical protein